MAIADHDLMMRIRARHGEAIASATAKSSIPPAFLAAVIANESGGGENAMRFEANIFLRIMMVFVGRKEKFDAPGIHHPLSQADLLAFVSPGEAEKNRMRPHGFTWGLKQTETLATSFGLTQIMGWHAIEFGWPLERITSPAEHLSTAIVLLTYFANRYNLDMGKEFEDLLRCWNTGRPDGKTYDPEYVPKALHRMAIYANLAGEA